jgi:hypothetical protein
MCLISYFCVYTPFISTKTRPNLVSERVCIVFFLLFLGWCDVVCAVTILLENEFMRNRNLNRLSGVRETRLLRRETRFSPCFSNVGKPVRVTVPRKFIFHIAPSHQRRRQEQNPLWRITTTTTTANSAPILDSYAPDAKT